MEELLHRFKIVDASAPAEVQRFQYGRFAGIMGVICNGIIFVAEFVLGLMTGSIALISDAVHNVTDVGGSLLSLLSFALTRQHADKEHPYGHGRFEYLLSIGFSVILFVIAFQLAYESYQRILEPKLVEVSNLMIICMALAMVIKFVLSRILKKLGKIIDSPILIANSKDSL
ncbi:MAG: cation diffusion facilitator family transporter, partial [Veillonella sp.]|nr:cation diffusion facilitator family transporter [Veillonella sp.]